MLRFTRPKEPATFTADVAAAQLRVEQVVAAGHRPTSRDFLPKWREFKAVLRGAQGGKCGYCEVFIEANQHGDVEHYRPKAEISRVAGHAAQPWTAEEPPPDTSHCDRGYWWLAYAWTNYLFACIHCNETWKRNLFPTSVAQPTPLTHGCEAGEVALLLSPYGAEPPERHLCFDGDGRILPRSGSLFGERTIETCGLHRGGLVTLRGPIARSVKKLLHKIATATTEAHAAEPTRDLHAFGVRDRPFAGMVRSLVADEMPEVVLALWPDHF